MGWKVWGEVLEQDDLTGGLRVSQPFKPQKNIILRACRIWLVNYNSDFDYLKLRIYSNRNSAPGKLLYESTNQRNKSDLFSLTDVYGAKETWFTFDWLRLRQDETYRAVLYSPGYVKTDDSFLCWRKDYPDPVYRTNNDVTLYSAGRQNHCITFITGDL